MTRLLLAITTLSGIAISLLTETTHPSKHDTELCTIFLTEKSSTCRYAPFNFLHGRESGPAAAEPSESDSKLLEEAFAALSLLQNNYFEAVNGTWPTSIDWTGAVVETMLSGMLATLTKSLDTAVKDHDWKQKENLIASIFAQATHSFYGQNAVGILDEVREQDSPAAHERALRQILLRKTFYKGLRRCTVGSSRMARSHQVYKATCKLALSRHPT